jgi:PAS domain S-box-containing protein
VGDSGIVGLFHWTLAGAIAEANDAFLTLLGYSRDDLAAGAIDWRRLTPPEFAERDEAAVRELLTTGAHRPFEKAYLARDGHPVPVLIASAFFDHSRERGVTVCIDVSAQKRVESERERLLGAEREARAEAEAANQAKAQFLAAMSHELRTPLNAIGGYADLLDLGLRGPVTDAQRADLARIKRSGQHLLSLINDILNFARLEAGRVELHLAPVLMREVLAGVEPLVAPQLAARALAYDATCADDVVAWADAEKVQQVLLNLLINASKFTEPGGRVTVECAHDDVHVHVHVRDTGRGITTDRLDRIFEPFVQIDRHLTQASQQGVGLGLAISRELARAMGGDITVASRPGHGSTFTLTLLRQEPTAVRLPTDVSTPASLPTPQPALPTRGDGPV